LQSRIPLLAAAVVIATLHLTSLPRTLWEFDEHFFALGVENYQPLLHHPPPPGCPVFLGAAKVAALFVEDPFRALVATNVVFLFVGFFAWAAAFRAISGSTWAAAAGALLLYASPALLISGLVGHADTGALALLGLGVWAGARGTNGTNETYGTNETQPPISPMGPVSPMGPILAAVFMALAVGWRPQVAVAAVALLAGTLLVTRTWRARLLATLAFGLTCLAWLIPLVVEAGGPASFWNWLYGQAAYYAAHDADLSRSGHSASHIALRFIAHPWGPKWLAVPVLGLALLGIRRNRASIPLAISALTYLAFALASMDPADAVRYAIPSLPLIALLAGTALARVPAVALLALLYAAGAYWYASPVLRTRAALPSPPVQAAVWIQAIAPSDAIILYDLPLRPHAEFHLRNFRQMRTDAALAQYGGDPKIPMVLLADGEVGDAYGHTFRWPDTDAYRKLTRQHYGAVSVITLPAEERFRVVEGVYAPERMRDGTAWRWLGNRAVLELPDVGAKSVRLRFRTPPEYPLPSNRVRVRIGSQEKTVDLARNASAEILLPLDGLRVEILPERTFIPANVPGANNRDRRTLSVMLTRVEQRSE
jgi:hypothetical protein